MIIDDEHYTSTRPLSAAGQAKQQVPADRQETKQTEGRFGLTKQDKYNKYFRAVGLWWVAPPPKGSLLAIVVMKDGDDVFQMMKETGEGFWWQ